MSLLLDAIARKPIPRPPIWLMRQAGRYLPEYRALREKAGGFMPMCQTPEIACEITLQPIRRYNFDAAIIFSDILTIPDAMGLGLSFQPGHGPQFAKPICNISDIRALGVPDPCEDLRYVGDAIRITKSQLLVPLIGFSGSPWTLAAYMVQGQSVPKFPKLMAMMHEAPEALSMLLSTLTQSVIAYLQAQIDAGADMVMLFDTWGGLLDHEGYQKYSLSHMQKIVQALKTDARYADVPIAVFTKGGGGWLKEIASTGCDVIGVDWNCDLAQAKAEVGGAVALQGNLNPATLKASDVVLQHEIEQCLSLFSGESGYIFNLGHGITPDVDPEKVKLLVEMVQNYGK